MAGPMHRTSMPMMDLRKKDRTDMAGMDLRTGAPLDADLGEKEEVDLPDEAKVEAIRQVLRDLEESVSEVTVSDAKRRKAKGSGEG